MIIPYDSGSDSPNPDETNPTKNTNNEINGKAYPDLSPNTKL